MKQPRTISIAKESESNHGPLRLQAHWSNQNTHRAVLFLHGYKGYADWGCWGLMCERLSEMGFHAFRLDFSGNGTTWERPNEIHDLEAWADNTYRQELHDAIAAVQTLRHRGLEVILMGHSRGGGIATIAAGALRNTNYSVKGLILLASVSDFESRFPKGSALARWESTDRWEVKNGRTGEVYHHKFRFYLDFQRFHQLLNIEGQAARVEAPVLIVHAEDDQAVPIQASKRLAAILKQKNAVQELYLKAGGHTLGSKEPWPYNKPLPKEMADLLPEIGHFIRSLA